MLSAVRQCQGDQVSYRGSVVKMWRRGQVLNIYINVGGLLKDFKRKRGAKVASTFNNCSM